MHVNDNNENYTNIYGRKYYEEIIGKTAREDISFGTPLAWNLIN